MNKFLIPLLVLIGCNSIQCSQYAPNPDLLPVVLPGQNGCGGGTFKLLGITNGKTVYCQTTQQPKIDFGQENCIDDFKKQLTQIERQKKIFCAVSQGTATTLNTLAQLSHAEQEQQTAGIILEGVLGSPEHAILHNAGKLSYIPFASYWAPYVAKKLMFPAYKPYGINALESAKKLSPNIPVIIIHDNKDFQLPHQDAENLYCALRNSGNNNVYLITTNNGYHFDVLAHAANKKQLADDIRGICVYHGMMHGTAADDTVRQQYQPDVAAIEQAMHRQKTVRIGLTSGAVAAAMALLSKSFRWQTKSK